jgi:acyl carrier protein
MAVKLQETVFEIISQELSLSSEAFSLETPLEELGIDSLKAITILYELEDRLDIEIPNEVFDSIRNVSDIVQQLQRLTARSDTVRLGE